MYILANKLIGIPVMSLQTGSAVATIEQAVVNQADLEVMALRCNTGKVMKQPHVVLMRDIRQFANDCVIIDSFDEIEDVDEIVRLRDIFETNFNPIGKQVISESGQKLGRVEDYTINLKTNMLQKLYVHQSLMKSILFNNLVIDRTQITDVHDTYFTVQDASITEPKLSPSLSNASKQRRQA